MKKYASDVVTSEDEPLQIIDKKTGSIIEIDNIVKYPEHLVFYGFFVEGGREVERSMEYDAVVNVHVAD